jgi:hypothetical protein
MGAADAGEWSSCRGVVMEFERFAGEGLTEARGLFCGKWMRGAAVPPVILGGLGNVEKMLESRSGHVGGSLLGCATTP